jgi:dTDP-4-amino-4,6-dideoxygalactose transaminase
MRRRRSTEIGIFIKQQNGGIVMKSILPYKSSISLFKEEIFKEFEEIFDVGILVLGDWTKKFEQEFSGSHGRRFGVAVTSDTAALEAALLMLKDYSKLKKLIVLMPDTAFFGCANVVFRLGGDVVPIPVEIGNGIMPTLEQLERCAIWVSRKSDCDPEELIYMAVYTAGMVARDMIEQIDWCRKKGIKVLEDCAHTHGATYSDGKLAGSYGDVATFSFYATKMVHSGEGGMVLVDNPDWDRWLRTYRNYGKTWGEGADPIFQDVSVIGYNWRMTELQAAIGMVLWRNYQKIYSERQRVERIYDSFFNNGNGRAKRLVIKNAGLLRPNLYKYIVLVDGLETEEQNHRLYRELEEKGVRLQTKCNPKPISESGLFRDRVIFYPEAFEYPKESLSYSLCHLCLPIYPLLSNEEAQYVAESVSQVVESGKWR